MTAPHKLRCPGAETLRLIGYRAVRDLLTCLAPHSRRPIHLDRDHEVASSTFHRHAPELLRVKAITRRTVSGPPRQVFYELGPSGLELHELVEGWLDLLQPSLRAHGVRQRDWRTPIGFAEAWAAGLTTALLDAPLSVIDIELVVRPARPGLTPHKLQRLLTNNCTAGFFVCEVQEGTERYQLADHGRYAVGELAATARFERLYMPATATPITADDVVAALRAHLPLLELPERMEGICEFAIEPDRGAGTGTAIAWADVQKGHVVATGVGPPTQQGTCWARGSIEEWMTAVIDRRPSGIRPAGDHTLGRAVLDELHSRLYPRYGRCPSTIRPRSVPSQ